MDAEFVSIFQLLNALILQHLAFTWADLRKYLLLILLLSIDI